jgi:ABC-type phosphate transport system substrate-binding protein
MKKITSVLATTVLFTGILGGCGNKSKTIAIAGSTALQPLVEEAASQYMNVNLLQFKGEEAGQV